MTNVSNERLRTIVERIERLEEEKAATANDIKEVYAEAKGDGYDVKILRKVVALRKQDQAARTEEEMVLDTYLGALGMGRCLMGGRNRLHWLRWAGHTGGIALLP